MTQEQKVLNYMKKYGSITVMQAFEDLRVTRLSAKIFTLRQKGEDIDNIKHSYKNSDGQTIQYVEYVLRTK